MTDNPAPVAHYGDKMTIRANVGPLRRLRPTNTNNNAALPSIDSADSVAAAPWLEDWTLGQVCVENNGFLVTLSGIGSGTDGSTFFVRVMGWVQIVQTSAIGGTARKKIQWTLVPLLDLKFTIGSKVGLAGESVTDTDVYACKIEVVVDYIKGRYSIVPDAAVAVAGGPARITFDPGSEVVRVQMFVTRNSGTVADAGLLVGDSSRM